MLSLGTLANPASADGLPTIDDAKRDVIMLEYLEVEPGAGEQPARLLITPQHLRLDNGNDQEGFVLLDRKARAIYNVNHRDQSVMVIAPKANDMEAPMKLDVNVTSEAMQDAPKVAGKAVMLNRVFANGEGCQQVVSAPGVLPDATRAMATYREVLAGEHKRILPYVPAETHDACDLAVNVFEPDLPVRFGLIVREWKPNGYQRILMNFAPTHSVARTLFELPFEYNRFSLE